MNLRTLTTGAVTVSLGLLAAGFTIAEEDGPPVDETVDAAVVLEVSRVVAIDAADTIVGPLDASDPVSADLTLVRLDETPAQAKIPPTTTTTTTAPPPPPPTTVPAPAPVSSGNPVGVIHEVFGSHGNAAVAVARCESGLNPRAMSPGGGNHGLFQINNVHRGSFSSVTGQPWSARYSSRANTVFAKWLFNQSGWGPWACKRVL